MKCITGLDLKVKVSGNKGKVNKKELVSSYRKYINFWYKYVDFLPFETPESYLAKLDGDQDYIDSMNKDKTGKTYFYRKTKGKLKINNITSEDIFSIQKLAVAQLKPGDEVFDYIAEKLESLF